MRKSIWFLQSVHNLHWACSWLSGKTAECHELHQNRGGFYFAFFVLFNFVIQQACGRLINVTLPLIPKIEWQQTRENSFPSKEDLRVCSGETCILVNARNERSLQWKDLLSREFLNYKVSEVIQESLEVFWNPSIFQPYYRHERKEWDSLRPVPIESEFLLPRRTYMLRTG